MRGLMSEKADHNVCRLCKWLSFLINNTDQQMTRLFQLNDARMRSWSKGQQPWLSENVAEHMYVGVWMQLGFKGGAGGVATVDGGSVGGGALLVACSHPSLSHPPGWMIL